MMRIIKYGNPILRMKAKPVTEFDEELRQTIDDMIETMQVGEGIGLAAPQVAISKAFFVIDNSLIEEGGQPEAIINPEILSSNGESIIEEGCLSVPEIREDVKRPDFIKVKYQDVDGKMHEEEFGGVRARVFQHELDHLKGIFFVDRLGAMKRKLLQKQLRQIAEEEMAERVEV
ncbi:peptide deformylase [candidate division KSB1 bacterium]|nr:peptide deformylase [candidate division KSB1 bacterium]